MKAEDQQRRLMSKHRCLCNTERTLWGNFVGNREVRLKALGPRAQSLERTPYQKRLICLGHSLCMLTERLRRCT